VLARPEGLLLKKDIDPQAVGFRATGREVRRMPSNPGDRHGGSPPQKDATPLLVAQDLAAELRRRLRQQEIVADFALSALRTDSLDAIFSEACQAAADGLTSCLARIIEYRASTEDFRVRAAAGWPQDVVGRVVGGGPRSPAGEAMRTALPVLCGENAPDEAASEDRIAGFRLPRSLREQGIRSAMIVPVQADGFGVLEVDSTEANAFHTEDLAFLRGLANILGAALDKQRREAALRRAENFSAAVLDACPDAVEVLDAEGRITSINANGLRLLELDLPASRLGLDWCRDWAFSAHAPTHALDRGPLPDDASSNAARALRQARAGGIGRFACFRTTGRGAPKWWDVLVASFTGRSNRIEGYVAVARDVTAQVLGLQAKDNALREKDLLMLEVHHRVKNSLQLVQNLLSLQARASGADTIGGPLAESANRVGTIAAIHDRLYRSGSGLTVEIGPYLEGLIEDLRVALSAGLDRTIRLDADHAVWPAGDVATLGLVLTELVTNSLKYGRGTVSVSFRQAPGEPAQLAVTDEGDGPPADFDPANSRGLGMRLVKGLLRGPGAGLTVTRQDGRPCFLARFQPSAAQRARGTAQQDAEPAAS